MGFGGGFGGGGGGVPPVTGNDGYALIEVDSVAAFRPILSSYIDPSFGISAFNLSGVAAIQEVGAEVSSPAFTAAYSAAPDAASVIDDQGNPSFDVSGTPTAFTYVHDYTKTANNAAVQFTLTASLTSPPSSSNKSVSVTWRPKGFWGVGPDGLSTEADIEGLTNKPLLASRAISFSADAGPSQHIYYAYPDSYGAATFYVEGWEGGFDLVGIVSVTNTYGVTQNYRLYKSTNPALGPTNVQVV